MSSWPEPVEQPQTLVTSGGGGGAGGWSPAEPEFHIMEYVNLLWTRRWLVLASVCVAVLVAGAWAFTRPKLYRAQSEMSVGEQTPQLLRNQINLGGNYWEGERFTTEQLRVLKTRRLAARVAQRLGLEVQPEFAGRDPAGVLMSMIDVKRVPETHIVTVTMTGPDSQRIAEWLNIYIEEYIAANIEDTLERTHKVFEVIQSRLDPLRDQLALSEATLVQFRERDDALLFADQGKNVISEQVSTLTTSYAQAKAERITLESKINALRQLRISRIDEISFPEIHQDGTILSLRQQRNNLEVELSQRLGEYREGHPQIKELRTRMAGIDIQIREQIDTVRASMQTDFDVVRQRENSLYENIQLLKGESIELSRQTLEYERLKRDYDQNKAFLEEMLARSKEVDITSTAAINNIRLIEPAVPPGGPFSPNVKQALLFGLMIGLIGGLALVFGLDYLDQSLRTPEQVERHLGTEVLSTLPRLTSESSRTAVEAFQALRTALILASRGEGCQILMVTSAVPGEGKTTCAFELAKVFASGGGKVLLIDADLRRPRLHKIVGLDNDIGLTTAVLGECSAREAVRDVSEVPGLYVVTSGPLPPNPPELFGKGSYKRLLDEARCQVDWVILDTPPIASVTDPVICASEADLALLVVQYGGARRQVIKAALRQLSRSNVRLAGVLLNKVDLERDYYYANYGYYRYSYESSEPEARRPAREET
ncbi:MAG: polysaccharide biosynthesis tyrosine autokinase [bacterium]|nr:polysaccharide biosynthesis tyrosine autokinase [bacterium]